MIQKIKEKKPLSTQVIFSGPLSSSGISDSTEDFGIPLTHSEV